MNKLTELTPLTELVDPTKEANKQAKFMIIAMIIFAVLVIGAIVFMVISNRRKKA